MEVSVEIIIEKGDNKIIFHKKSVSPCVKNMILSSVI